MEIERRTQVVGPTEVWVFYVLVDHKQEEMEGFLFNLGSAYS